MLSLDKSDVKNIKIASLAFIGDSVFDLLVKGFVVTASGCNQKRLHETAIQYVCCKSQAEYIKHLLPVLTEEEIGIYKRGRNYHPAHMPRKANCSDYHEATALEAVFGYLYLTDNKERLEELFSLITEIIQTTDNNMRKDTPQ